MPRTPASVALLVRLGREHGVAAGTSLRGTGLTLDGLDDPKGEVRAAQELRVIANLVDALGDPPGLGVEAGARYHLTTYGIFGFAMISSPDLRSAIATGLRFLDLTFSLCRIEVEEDDEEARLLLDAPDVPLRLRRFVVERDCSAIRVIQRELLAQQLPIRMLSLAFPPPPDPTPYLDAFGVEPVFGAERTALHFDVALLDRPLPQADAHTTALAQEQCRQLLAQRVARTGTAGRVRDLLMARPSDPPGEPEVAAALSMSDRTLRHHLAAEGTSYRALLDEVRERLAEELLVTGGLPVAEVAQRLGYQELSSFSQAFRRWKGMGPRAYRARSGSRPASPVSPPRASRSRSSTAPRPRPAG